MKGHKPPRFRSSKQRRRGHLDLGKGRKSDITPKTPREPPLGQDGPPTPFLKFNSTKPCPKSAAVICIDWYPSSVLDWLLSCSFSTAKMPLSERCCWRRARSLAPSAKALGLCRRSDSEHRRDLLGRQVLAEVASGATSGRDFSSQPA